MEGEGAVSVQGQRGEEAQPFAVIQPGQRTGCEEEMRGAVWCNG